MEEFKFEPNFKYTPHMVILSLLFICQYFSKNKEVRSNLNPEEKKKADGIFWKYIIIFKVSKAADWCLGPLVFEFYEKYHGLETESIAKLMAVSFMSSLFLGPLFVGYLNDKSDKKFPCILYGALLSFSSYVRQTKHPLSLILAQIASGMSTNILYTSFENWFMAETNAVVKDKEVKDNLLNSAFEKSMILDSLIAVGTSLITGILKRNYGIQAPYFFSIFLCMVSMILCGVFLTSIKTDEEDNKGGDKQQKTQHEFIDVFKNIKESILLCYNTPSIVLIGLSESFLFATLHIFIFIWTPTIREADPNVDTGDIFTLFMLSLMCGGSLFRAFSIIFKDILTVAKILSFVCTVAFVIANLRITYNWTLFSFLCYEITVGLMYPTYSKIKSEFLPNKLRGTLMNVFKIPFNIIVIFLLFTMNKIFTMKQLLLVEVFLGLITFIIHVSTFNRRVLRKPIEDELKQE